MVFINTRPQDRAQALTDVLQAHGMQVFNLPLLELQPQPLDGTLTDLFAQLPQAQRIIVVSPSAAHIGMRYLQQLGMTTVMLEQCTWLAVGQSTARVLKTYGIDAQVPEVETSEGLLGLNILQHDLQQDPLTCVAIWRGEGGRQFMLQQLQQRGVRLLNLQLYRRQCPTTAPQQWTEILQQLPPCTELNVLISSEASWLNWLSIYNNVNSSTQGTITAMTYWVLGARLANLLHASSATQQHRANVRQLSDLQPQQVCNAILGTAS